MLRNLIAVGVLLAFAQGARADYECPVKPQDDITVTQASVEASGSDGDLVITPQGSITFNGHAVQADATLRQQAINWQAAVRKDLPWIDQGAHTRLDNARAALDKIIVEKLGADSHVRTRLTTLDTQLKAQMNRVIEHRSDGLMFHHQAIDQVRSEGDKLVQSTMGGILQDSLNELGSSQSSGSNPLQALMGNLGGLQQSVRSQMKTQEADFRQFGEQVCQRVTVLEKQRTAIFQQLKK
ncbi:DUF2884 family protein [Tatumella saanichensis]|uniref:DUF2884 family protein n=1 Tax=Tatumella saanichensis TaxID=480813 RepID=UPI0004A3CF7E|nr:DUF2884 family protein [Tatumella saanichensis]